MCSGDDDDNGDRDIGSVGLWETERFCEKKVMDKYMKGMVACKK